MHYSLKHLLVLFTCFLSLSFYLCGQQNHFKNIIFDLGGVLLKGGHVDSKKTDDNSTNLHCIKVCGSKSWKNWHRGKITKEALVKHLTKWFDKQDVELVVSEALSPERSWIEETTSLIKQLKHAGYKIFLLSNLSREAYELYIPHNEIFSYFDGMVFSFKIGSIKPEPSIYKYLLKRYKINPHESVFIDDKKINVDAAQACGITGIVYSQGTLEESLKKLNIAV